jgi:putative membrane protein
MENGKNFYTGILVAFFAVLAWSGFRPPAGYFTWALEIFPAILALAILASTIKKFEFTKLVYVLLLFHSFILMIGGHTTYAEMPVFNWIRDHFGLERNYYDRLGHFAQGFVPALVAREYFIRRKIIASRRWLNFIVVMFLLGFAAFYEFIEWWVSLMSGEAGNAFLGTQGDIWDTQWDMFMCFVGSIVSLAFLSKYHDKLISKQELSGKK